ncbi:MAG: TonB-dependent receptor plug domain-containing protein [Treponema sp.]|nr:TonB-dependent receptor plug domain-containing protein [Treponema sp.]
MTLVLFLLFFAAFPLHARDVAIIVQDIELALPLEGAVIRSWDGSQYVCDREGKALVSVPDGRQTMIQAAYPGYDNGRLLVAAEGDTFTLGLRLSGIMEGRELVIEAARPGSSETRTGRSVAVSGREIAQTAEIGIVEDVVSSIKLLPGVGYAGFFDALPSIRGGDPNDLSAALDGYYITNPYHWGGGFSIFDPRMVQSAQLSHGVFSSRYGHTISGLLEVTSKKPSPTETEFELGVNTSAANFNLSFPLAGKGGILAMGRITYYDPFIALAKQMAKAIPLLEAVESIRVAPYIRSTAITGSYRFSDSIELNATGFWGMDGIGVTFDNGTETTTEMTSRSSMIFDWTNYQGFINAVLSWNPRSNMLLKLSSGIGYEDAVVDADIQFNIIDKRFSATPENEWYYSLLSDYADPARLHDPYSFSTGTFAKESDVMFNVQARIDYDWELGSGLLAAAGLQEMFNQYRAKGSQKTRGEKWLGSFGLAEQYGILADMGIDVGAIAPIDLAILQRSLLVSVPVQYDPDAGNRLLSTSGYALAEYRTPDNRLNAELGLRLDHYTLLGRGFTLQSQPALNPRLNVDYNVLKNYRMLESLDIGAGTGLFTSMNNNIFIAEKEYGIDLLKPNRSWTSILGAKLEFAEGVNFNIEGYYKYVFDRMYVPIYFTLDDIDVRPQFNGEGRVWGIDLMLQKVQSRLWDGWISYSYSWAKYRDPDSGDADMGISGGLRGDGWYFPSYHRFHNLNLVLNIRPAPHINIYTRFGLASGTQLMRRIGDGPLSYPVYVYDEGSADNHFIEMYRWPSVRDENNRTTPSLPMDVKFSIFGQSQTGKARYEVYFAIENVLALVYAPQGNTTYNPYTGEVDSGSESAAYGIPIPIPSFGFKISY